MPQFLFSLFFFFFLFITSPGTLAFAASPDVHQSKKGEMRDSPYRSHANNIPPQSAQLLSHWTLSLHPRPSLDSSSIKWEQVQSHTNQERGVSDQGGGKLSSSLPLHCPEIVFQPFYENITVPNTLFGGLLEKQQKDEEEDNRKNEFIFPENFDPLRNQNLLCYTDALPFHHFRWSYYTTMTTSSDLHHPKNKKNEKEKEGRMQSSPSLYYFLRIHGINYKGNLTVNGYLVMNESTLVGTFRRFEEDLTPYVQRTLPWRPSEDPISSRAVSSQEFSIRFDLLVPEDHTFPSKNNSTDLAITFVDWNPEPPDRSGGLWRPVELITSTVPYTMQGVSVSSNLLLSDPSSLSESITSPSSIQLNISVILTAYFTNPSLPQKKNVTVWLSIFSEHLNIPLLTQTVSIHNKEDHHATRKEVRVVFSWLDYSELRIPWTSDDLLWWPWQMGGQTQHGIAIGILNEEKGKTGGSIKNEKEKTEDYVELLSTKFSIRQVEKRFISPSSSSSKKSSQQPALQFIVNKNPILIRGGGWAPDIFLRNNVTKLRHQMKMVKDMGLNAIRLEGKMESEDFFNLADQFGLMVLPGWCCCDAWQHWSDWREEQYFVARESLRSQVRRFAVHPSVITFLYSSDELPPERVEQMYLKVFQEELWPNPTVSSASATPSPISGPSGVKMSGPYAWVPPMYWLQDSTESFDDLGGAWGFLTEGGPGASPMTYTSWIRTVSADEVWNTTAGKGPMSPMWSYYCANPSGLFHDLRYFNPAMVARYGGVGGSSGGNVAPARKYLYKAQVAAYEGIRAMFEGYTKNKVESATGLIQWMMNNARPSHFWHLYDFYLSMGGGYFGAKKACGASGLTSSSSTANFHVLLSYVDGTVSAVNSRYIHISTPITIFLTAMRADGEIFFQRNTTLHSILPNAVMTLHELTFPYVSSLPLPLPKNTSYFVRLSWEEKQTTKGGGQFPPSSSSSRKQPPEKVKKSAKTQFHNNWYWLSTQMDVLNWTDSNYFRTGCQQWADFRSLSRLLKPVTLLVEITTTFDQQGEEQSFSESTSSSLGISFQVVITNGEEATNGTNNNNSVAFFIGLKVLNTSRGNEEVTPLFYSDNYITLAPGEHSGVIEVHSDSDDGEKDIFRNNEEKKKKLKREGLLNKNPDDLDMGRKSKQKQRKWVYTLSPSNINRADGTHVIPLHFLTSTDREGELKLLIEVWNNLMA